VTPELDLVPFVPELVLVAAAIVGLLYEALARGPRYPVHLAVALAGIVVASGATLALWRYGGDPTVLAGAIATDRLAVLARLTVLGAAFCGLLLGTHAIERDPAAARGEFFPLLLFATTGMTLIVAAADLIVVFLALEVLSLSLYVLTGLPGRRAASEASLKYFLLGAFSSAFFLYGVAMVYGATGTTRIPEIANALVGRTGEQGLALLAAALLLIGLGFKVSAAPFHMWTPDVYQGAPTSVTAFMSAATKVAAFAALIRVFDVGLQALRWDWTPLVAALAAVSVVLGSVLAIAQADVKRMLAYSSVAHAGFILTGLTASNADGIGASLFYLIAYSAMTIGSFAVVGVTTTRGEDWTDLDAYRGLYRRDPHLAAAMALFLVSLAGVPPTAGFIAKVGVFGAAIGAGYVWLALLGVLASVAAAYVYLRVIVLMFMVEPEEALVSDPAPLPRIAIAIGAAIVLVLGLFPGLVTDLVRSAAVLRW
jgi:NADH-quinone oxidoreductase subunit N